MLKFISFEWRQKAIHFSIKKKNFSVCPKLSKFKHNKEFKNEVNIIINIIILNLFICLVIIILTIQFNYMSIYIIQFNYFN